MSDTLKFAQPIQLKSLASDPSSPTAGEVYFNTTLNVFRGYNGTVWSDLGVGSFTPPDNQVSLHTGNGMGSTNTKIRRFTTAVINTGTAITYADSAANGASFTINENGMYAISYWDGSTTDSIYIGLSLNSAQLTTAINSITAADRIALSSNDSTGRAGLVSVTRRFTAGDIIRAHDESAADYGADAGFTIVKITP